MNEQISILAVLKWLCAGVVAWWIHDVPIAMQLLIWFMAVDYATGIAAAIVKGRLSSRVGMRGLVQKGGIICLLLFGHRLEMLVGHEFGAEMFGAFGYSVNEAISITENFARMGVPLPARAIEILEAIKRLRVKRATAEQLKRLEDD